MPYRPRDCEVCTRQFTPPRKGGLKTQGDHHLRFCPSCRRAVLDTEHSLPPPVDGPVEHLGAAPLKQVVFDLETWGLDRGWGVTMVACFLIHGLDKEPIRKTMTLRDYGPWKSGVRSDDREIVREVLDLLRRCHIAYAHNGERFDMRWLRTVALKYGMDMPRLKLVDPCQIAWKKYVIGRNSLEAVGDFIGIPQGKLHISPDVWRKALMDNDDESWKVLVERCESDVDILNAIASKVTGDIGMIDYQGSWR